MKKRECKKETVEMNIDKLSNVKSTLNERNKRIRTVQIKGMIIALLVIALAIVTVIGVRNPKEELKAFEAQELSVVKQYEELDESEDVLEETQDVQFSVFFLRDIDNDEELEKIKGTCKRIGEEDILYMDLKLNSGQLKDAKIEIDSKNFFIQTALSKDEIIKNDYYSNNITQIELNDLDNNAQKLIVGKIRSGNYENLDEIASALNQNINNYSRKDNKIIFTAKYIKDGKEIDIRKEIDIAVDWYVELAQDKNEKVHCEVDKRFNEGNKVTYEISVDSKSISGNSLIKNNRISGVIPQRNSENPIDVKLKNENVDFNYNQDTREFEIIENSSIDENGLIVENVPVENKYLVEVSYEDSISESDNEEIIVESETEIYNNNNNVFDNPVKVASVINVTETVGVAEKQGDEENYVIWYTINDGMPTRENVVQMYRDVYPGYSYYATVVEGDLNTTDWFSGYVFESLNIDGGYIKDGVEYSVSGEDIDFIPDAIYAGSIVTINYATPRAADYTVEYYKAGVLTETEKITTQIPYSTTKIKLDVSDFNISKYEGYKLDVSSIPESVSIGGTVKLEYVVDETQTKNLWYQIWYSKNGNMPEAGQSVTVNKTVLKAMDDYVPVVEGDINITDRFSGYIFSGINVDGKYKVDDIEYDSYSTQIDYLPDSILSTSFVTVLYETPKSVSYNIEYYKDGVLQSSDTETITTQIAKSKTSIKIDSSSFDSTKYKGYKLDKSSIPTSVEAGGTIKLQYVFDETQTKELTYTLWYMLNGNFPTADNVVHKKATVHVLEDNFIPVQDGDINITDWFSGYVFYNMNIDGGYIKDGVVHSTVGEDITFIPDEIESGTIIMVNYETAKVANYSVEYYKGGVLQSGDTYRYSTYVAKSHDGILTVDKSKINLVDKYYGYKTTTTIPDTVASGTTIKVYYEVDPSQTKDVTATVYFIKDDVAVEEIDVKQTVQVLIDTVDLTKENIVIENRYDGYKFDGIDTLVGAIDGSGSQDPKWLTYWPDKVYDGSYLEVNYVKRNDLVYTVEYYFDGVIDSSLTETINNQTYGSQVSAYTDKVKTGYTLDVVEPITIGTGENVLKVYYVTDETQTKEMTYTVEFYKNGVLSSSDTISKVKTVQVLENYVEVDKEEINIVDKYYGYKYDYIMVYFGVGVARVPEPTPERWDTIPDEVTEGTYLRVYYVTDESQTKDLSYTVEYYKDNVLVTEDTQVVKNTVQVLQSDTMTVDESQINVEDKYLGYEFSELIKVQKTRVPELEGTENNPIIPDMVNSGTTIQVYYVKRTDLSYTVNYLEQDTNKVLYTSKVVNNQTYLSLVTETARSIYGYDFVNETETIEITTGDNVINFYYTAKNTFYYVINYRDKATDMIVESSKVVKNVTYGQTYIEEYIDVEGYNSDGDQIEITVTSNGLQYDLYYTARSDLSYTVEYYFNGTKDDSLTEIYNNQTYGTKASIYTDKVKTGYKFNYDNTPINIGLSNNVIEVYYTIDDTQTKELSYTLNFYKENIDEPVETLVFTETVHVLDEDILTVNKDVEIENRYIGYYFDYIDTTKMEIATYAGNEPVMLEELPTEVYDGAELNVLYKKRTDLSYVVNYLEKNTGKVLADSKFVDNQTYLDVVTESAIEIYGYNSVTIEETLTIDVSENVIEFYYTPRTDAKYTVYYLDEAFDGNWDVAPEKHVTDAVFGQTYTEYAPEVDGFTIKDNVKDITLTTIDNSNYIFFYYTRRNDLTYRVEYYYNGVKDDSLTETFDNQVFDTLINTYTDNAKPGYKFEKATPIRITTGENVLKVYYVTDEEQTKTINYTVKYYKDGVHVESDDQIVEKTIQVLEPEYINVNIEDINTNDKYLGYKFDKAVNEGMDSNAPTGTHNIVEVANHNGIINIYYVLDDSQTKELSYQIEFYKDYILVPEDTLTFTKTVQILEEDIIEVDKENIEINNKYEGYYFTEIVADMPEIATYSLVVELEELPTEVRDGAILEAYYEKRTDLSYVVNYINQNTGETLADSKLVDNQTYLDVITENAIEIYGYNSVNTTETHTIGVDDNIINFYYTPRTDAKYNVYYLDEGFDGNWDVAPEKNVIDAVFGQEYTEYAPEVDGFTIDENVKTIIADSCGNPSYVFFYYTRRNDLTYRVEYYYNGVKDDSLTETFDNQVFETLISTYTDNVKPGYKLEKATPIRITTGENVLKVYYVTDDAQTKTIYYKVSYYKDGQYHLSDTTSNTVQYLAPDMLNVYKALIDTEGRYEGYYCTGTDPEIIPDTIEHEGEIKVYYEKRTDLTYTVNYLEEGTNEVLNNSKLVENQTYQSTVTENAIDIFGYTAVNSEETITIDVENNVINFYYAPRTDFKYTIHYVDDSTMEDIIAPKVVENAVYGERYAEEAVEIEGYVISDPAVNIRVTEDNMEYHLRYSKRTDLSYTVEYYFDGIIDETLTEIFNNQTFKSEVSSYIDKVKVGYKLERATNPITIGVSNNIIKVYYIKDDTQTKELSYTLNFYKENIDEPVETLEFKETVYVLDEDIITVNKDVEIENRYTGYYFDHIDTTKMEIATYTANAPVVLYELPTEVYDGAVLDIYYKRRADLSYVVNYLEQDTDKVLADSKFVDNQTYLDVITETAIDIYGYTPLVNEKSISIYVSDNVIEFYYTPRDDFKYTVKYIDNATRQEIYPAKVVENVIYSKTYIEEAIEIDGYHEIDSQLSIKVDSSDKVITFAYNKRTDLSYKVEYYYAGQHDESKDVVYDNIEYNTVIDTYEDKTENGYIRVREENFPLTVGVGENIIRVYYSIDSEQTKDLFYDVAYYKDGEHVTTDTFTKTVQVLEPSVLEVDKSKIITEGKFKGYYCDRIIPEEIPDVVDYGTVIHVYYEKQTDLTYTVNYLEEGSNEVLSDSKLVENQTYQSIVTENAIDIFGYTAVNSEETITIDVENNVINFYYAPRTDFKYTIHYVDDSTMEDIIAPKVVENAVYGERYAEEAVEIEGYVISDPAVNIRVTKDNMEFHLRYSKRTDLSYTVEYYFDGIIDETLTEIVNNQTFKAEINSYTDKVKAGYKLESANVPLVVGVSDNVIKVYYIADDTQTKELSYSVEYYKDNVLDSTITDRKTVQLLETETLEVNYEMINTENKFDGYNFVKTEPETIPEIVNNGDVIKVYYEIRTDLSYVVNYLEEGTDKALADSKFVDNKTFEEVVTENAIDIVGYNKDVKPKTIIISTGENTINFYYSKMNDLEYVVKYLEEGTNKVLSTEKVVKGQIYLDGVQESAVDIEGYIKINPTENKVINVTGNEIVFYYRKVEGLVYKVQYLEKDTEAKVAEEKQVDGNTFGDEISEIAIDIDGYNREEPTIQTIVIGMNENVIKFYYTKRADLSYTVKYIDQDTQEELLNTQIKENQVFNTEITEKAIQIEGYNVQNPEETIIIGTGLNEIIFNYKKVENLTYKVQYLEKDTNIVLSDEKVVDGKTFKDEVSETAIDIDGYVKEEPINQTIMIGMNDNVIKFYYTKRVDLSYTVKYIDQDTQEEILPDLVKENMIFDTEVHEEAPEIEGYNVQNKEENITIGIGINEIIFYYKKVEGLVYKVQYLEKDTNIALAEEKVVEGNKFNDEISEIAIDISGYECENSLETIVIGMDENIIKFYYIKKADLTYKVEYYYDEVIDNSKTEVFEDQEYQTVINSYDNKLVDGYRFDRVENIPLTINDGENVIRVYYVRDEFEYRIEYYYDGVLDEANTVVSKAKFEDIIDTYEDKVKDEFAFDRVENIPLKITSNTEVNVIKVYYATNVFSYRINYYYDNVIDVDAIILQKAIVGEQINDYPDKIKPGYEFDRVDNLPLVITKNAEENVIDVYYKAKSSTIVVKYVDKNNGNELISEKTIEGKVFEKYNLDNALEEIEGYTLVEKPENMTVEFAEEAKVYTFYYSKNTQVIVKYLEKDETLETDEDNILLEEIIIDGYVGKDYVTVNKNFETYNYEESSENTTGKMTEEIIIVKYYYSKIKYGIVEKHIDVKTEEILETKTYEVAVGETYKVNPRKIEGYDLVDTMLPENAEGVVEDKPIEVTYYYIRNASVKVEYVDSISKEMIAYHVIEGHEGDEYLTEAKVLEDYVLDESKLPENAEGTMNVIVKDDSTVVTEIVVRYYYIAKAKVIEKHIDIKSEEVLEEIVHDGFEGKEYELNSKEFDGYDLVEDRLPENSKGKMTKDSIEVKYYYIRKTTVTVEHINIETGEKLTEIAEDGKVIDPNVVIDGHEGDEYNTKPENFKKFKVVEEKLPNNSTGIMKVTIDENGNEVTNTVVRYYYIAKVEVVEKHIDIKTGKEIEEEIVHEGNEGDHYEIPSKEYEGYDIVEDRKPENAEGTMSKDVVEVKYYYIRRTKVVVEYIDKETGEIVKETIEIRGHEGDEYESKEQEIDGYKLVKEKYPENSKGTMDVKVNEDGSVETITYVRYYYEKVGQTEQPNIPEQPEEPEQPNTPEQPEEQVKKKGKVVVKYLEKGTNKVLAKEKTIEGNVDDDYSTDPIEIDKYTLDKKEPANKKGKIKEGTTEVVYYYFLTKTPAKDDVSIKPTDTNKPENEEPFDGKLPSTGTSVVSNIILITILIIIVANIVLFISRKVIFKKDNE